MLSISKSGLEPRSFLEALFGSVVKGEVSVVSRVEIQKASLLVFQWLAFCAIAVLLWVSAGSRASMREVLTILASALGAVSILWIVLDGNLLTARRLPDPNRRSCWLV